MEPCTFCKIVSGEVAVQPVYQDNEFLAFPDRDPKAPVHVLLIPKTHYSSLMEVQDSALLGRMMAAAQAAARDLGIAGEGFRAVINNGPDGGQTVYHLHVHLLGGRFMQWPPG
ncbi:MAG TPA: histidine triad nucleotide-binding protein [Chthonomonadales bacterium]|nr:histidine triad nucleotide-binding protein [Chthonomonadales bacterium]